MLFQLVQVPRQGMRYALIRSGHVFVDVTQLGESGEYCKCKASRFKKFPATTCMDVIKLVGRGSDGERPWESKMVWARDVFEY
jgi:hypothetical protein